MSIIARGMSYRRMDLSLEFMSTRLQALEYAQSPEERDSLINSIHIMLEDLRTGLRGGRFKSPRVTRMKNVPFSSSTVYTFTADKTSPFRITRIRKQQRSVVETPASAVRSITFPAMTSGSQE